MAISIDTLWQTISGTIFSKELRCTMEISIDSLWERISGTFCLSNWDVHGNFYRHLVTKNI